MAASPAIGPDSPISAESCLSISALERGYDSAIHNMTALQELKSAEAARYRAEADSFDAIVGQLTADGHDAATIKARGMELAWPTRTNEAATAGEAMQEAARRCEEAAVAVGAAVAALSAARRGLSRHDLMREAVDSHEGPATRTAAYASD